MKEKQEKPLFIVGENQQNIKLHLFNNNKSYLYIQNDLNDKRFRIAANYKVLNKIFKLKIDIQRELKNDKIKAIITKVKDYNKTIIDLSYSNQKLQIDKYHNESEDHCIMIVTKIYDGVEHRSVFQGSSGYKTIDDFLDW